MHNNLLLPLRSTFSISFLIEKNYPYNLEYFLLLFPWFNGFLFPHSNLYPPASSLNLTWKQHKVIHTGVRAAIRSKVADVELGGVPSRQGPHLAPGGNTWAGKKPGQQGKNHVRVVSASRWRSGDLAFRMTPPNADLAPACAGTTWQVSAKHTHPSSSPHNIYNQFQRWLLKTSQGPW